MDIKRFVFENGDQENLQLYAWRLRIISVQSISVLKYTVKALLSPGGAYLFFAVLEGA